MIVKILRKFASCPHKDIIFKQINSNPILFYCKSTDPLCEAAIAAIKDIEVSPAIIELDEQSEGSSFADALEEITKESTLPYIFINGDHIGGYKDLLKGINSGSVLEKLRRANISYKKTV